MNIYTTNNNNTVNTITITPAYNNNNIKNNNNPTINTVNAFIILIGGSALIGGIMLALHFICGDNNTDNNTDHDTDHFKSNDFRIYSDSSNYDIPSTFKSNDFRVYTDSNYDIPNTFHDKTNDLIFTYQNYNIQYKNNGWMYDCHLNHTTYKVCSINNDVIRITNFPDNAYTMVYQSRMNEDKCAFKTLRNDKLTLNEFIEKNFNDMKGENIKTPYNPKDIIKQIEEIDQKVTNFLTNLTKLQSELQKTIPEEQQIQIKDNYSTLIEKIKNKQAATLYVIDNLLKCQNGSNTTKQ